MDPEFQCRIHKGSPIISILSQIYSIPLLLNQVATQLSSRGWVDRVVDLSNI